MTAQTQSGSHPIDPRTVAITTALSSERLAPYLRVMNGSVRGAMSLYQWNIAISAAMYESLHVFEVMLRNAMDECLCTWNATQSARDSQRAHGRDWLLDPSHLLRRLAGGDIDRATDRAKRALRGSPPRHADVLAQLSLGTWRFLLPDRDPGKQLLWKEALNGAFPHLEGTPRELVGQVDSVYRVRNRVAHLEPLLRSGIARDNLVAMRSVLAAVDPQLSDFLNSRQRITSILKARPT